MWYFDDQTRADSERPLPSHIGVNTKAALGMIGLQLIVSPCASWPGLTVMLQ